MEFDGQGKLLARYQPGLAIDEPLTLTRNGETYVYHRDGLGSVIALSDSRGKIVQRYQYDVWGNPIHIQDPEFKQPFLYTGREWDEESGLYYYRARYYDPRVGRFLSEDPIGLAGGINRYAYVEGNPINWVDPLGDNKGGAPFIQIPSPNFRPSSGSSYNRDDHSSAQRGNQLVQPPLKSAQTADEPGIHPGLIPTFVPIPQGGKPFCRWICSGNGKNECRAPGSFPATTLPNRDDCRLECTTAISPGR